MRRGGNRGKRAAAGALALALIFTATPSFAAGELIRKTIPVPQIPRKKIPKEVRFKQAPAFDKRQNKNRRLVNEARGEGRRLRRTGTAYEKDFR